MSASENNNTPEAHFFEDDGAIPNNPYLPLLLYKNVKCDSGVPLDDWFERCFLENGWLGAWRNGIYPFEHYHSLSHEVLAVYSGCAKVRFGGVDGLVTEIRKRDMVVIPAGVGHCNLGASGDFRVLGAYPDGRDYDTLRGEPSDRPKALENIAAVPLPAVDPAWGKLGPLVRLWNSG